MRKENFLQIMFNNICTCPYNINEWWTIKSKFVRQKFIKFFKRLFLDSYIYTNISLASGLRSKKNTAQIETTLLLHLQIIYCQCTVDPKIEKNGSKTFGSKLMGTISKKTIFFGRLVYFVPFKSIHLKIASFSAGS